MKEVKWIENILKECSIKLSLSIIYCDNLGAIKIAEKNSSMGRTKHLDTRLQHIKDLVSQKQLILKYVPSEHNLADIFTKPLGRINFHRLCNKLLIDTSDKEEC